MTAHSLLALSRPHACKLQELYIRQAWHQYRFPELDGLVYKAISRFTSLTALTLNGLAVEAGTLQVSSRSICALLKDPPHNKYVYITEGQPVVWQGLSGLSSLRNFYCNGLICPDAGALSPRFSGSVAQALWTLALGWPLLNHFTFTNCTLSSDEVSSTVETPPGIHQLR